MISRPHPSVSVDMRRVTHERSALRSRVANSVPFMGQRSRTVAERRSARVRRRSARARGELLGVDRGCLFCREADGGFVSAEHVIPECLGNTELVLDNGIVCDRCNNEVLSQVDQALCEFFPIQMFRSQFGIPRKDGTQPKARFSTGSMQHRDGTLVVELNNPGDEKTVREVARIGDAVRLRMETTGGRRLNEAYASMLSRAVLKAALEAAWLDHGDMMLEDRFDHVREAVLGAPSEGFIMISKKSLSPPTAAVSLTYNLADHPLGERMWAYIDVYGITIATDSRLTTPQAQPPDDLMGLITFASRVLKK